MRWLLIKDLRILQRSLATVGVLAVYPLCVSLLMGFALSRQPQQPKVAFYNGVKQQDSEIDLGGEQLNLARYSKRLFQSIEPVYVHSRAEAVKKIKNGEVVGALVIPPDVTRKLQNTVNLGAGERPTVEVIYSLDGPLQGELVDSLVNSQLAKANQALSDELTKTAARYLKILLNGGSISFFGGDFSILGLRATQDTLQQTLKGMPKNSDDRKAIEQVIRFSKLAVDNLGVSDQILTAISAPVKVQRTVLGAKQTSLDTFAVVSAVTGSIMLVSLLLAAGLFAIETEERTLNRLLRGSGSIRALLSAKIVLAACCGLFMALIMVGVVGIFVPLVWSRVPLWIFTLLLAGFAFAALGVAIGSLARDVRAASLLAILLALPVMFLAFVPDNSVSPALAKIMTAISSCFPFQPALTSGSELLAGSGLGSEVFHMIGLTAAYAGIAWFGVRLRRRGS